MRKRLISLVAAAALVGSLGMASIASAGTVTTQGDTNISLGGFVMEYYIWSNHQNPFGDQAAPNLPGKNPAQTTFSSSSNVTRLWLNLDNKAEGITGRISGDFEGSGAGNGFRMRQAYFEKSFCQEGCNYKPWLLIGSTYTLDFPVSNSLLAYYDAGNAGTAATVPVWVPQIAFGINFDLGNVKLNPEIAVVDNSGFTNMGAQSGISSVSNNAEASNINLTSRTVMPGFGIKIPVTFNTGLGAPASVYAVAQFQPYKLTGAIGGKTGTDDETGWEAGGGASLPIYFVTLKGDIAYSKGMPGESFMFAQGPSAVSPYSVGNTTPGYWLDANGGVNTTRATQWDVEAKINFQQLTQVPFALAGGYSQVVFSQYIPYSLDNINGSGVVTKASTYFANVTYNLTKSTTLGVEFDHNKTYYAYDSTSQNKSNEVVLMGMYAF